MDPFTWIIILGTCTFSTSLCSSVCNWWDRYCQFQQRRSQAQETEQRSHLKYFHISKFDSPNRFCRETKRLTDCLKERKDIDTPHTIELILDWDERSGNQTSSIKTLRSFHLPLPGKRICLKAEHLWVQLVTLDQLNVSGYLFEASSTEELATYFETPSV